MKTQNGFTLMKGASEIASFLKGKKVTRTVSKIQIHHMSLPSYSTWEKTDKRIFDEPHFGRTNSLNDYGKKTWGSKDDSGKYIAQHFSLFPDGYITSGRNLNNTPIGIKGWNTGAICIEIYGNFDKGQDTMNSVQKQAVIELVGELCKRFKITPSENTIRYHCWFTAGGSYLGGYYPGKSAKTCPGTNFFGGNTMTAYKANFLPAIKKYVSSGNISASTPSNNQTPTQAVDFKVKVDTDVLNIRKSPDANSALMGSVKKGEVYTIVKTSGKWGYLKSGAGWIHLDYTVKVSSTPAKSSEFKVKVDTDVLNIRKSADSKSAIVGKVKKGEVYTITKTNGDWGYLKSGAGWIHLGYTKKL